MMEMEPKTNSHWFAKATYKINDAWSVYGDLQERFVTYKTTGLTSDNVPLEVDENYSFFNLRQDFRIQ